MPILSLLRTSVGQREEIGAALQLIETLTLAIHERVGRTVIGGRRPCLIETRWNAHHDIATEVFAGQLVPQRVPNEIHSLRERVAFHRKPELAGEKIGDPVLEAFPLVVRKRQIARIDAGTKSGACFFRGDAAAGHRDEHNGGEPGRPAKLRMQWRPRRRRGKRRAERGPGSVAHSFSSSTFARVMSPFERPFRYA